MVTVTTMATVTALGGLARTHFLHVTLARMIPRPVADHAGANGAKPGTA